MEFQKDSNLESGVNCMPAPSKTRKWPWSCWCGKAQTVTECFPTRTLRTSAGLSVFNTLALVWRILPKYLKHVIECCFNPHSNLALNATKSLGHQERPGSSQRFRLVQLSVQHLVSDWLDRCSALSLSNNLNFSAETKQSKVKWEAHCRQSPGASFKNSKFPPKCSHWGISGNKNVLVRFQAKQRCRLAGSWLEPNLKINIWREKEAMMIIRSIPGLFSFTFQQVVLLYI